MFVSLDGRLTRRAQSAGSEGKCSGYDEFIEECGARVDKYALAILPWVCIVQ